MTSAKGIPSVSVRYAQTGLCLRDRVSLRPFSRHSIWRMPVFGSAKILTRFRRMIGGRSGCGLTKLGSPFGLRRAARRQSRGAHVKSGGMCAKTRFGRACPRLRMSLSGCRLHHGLRGGCAAPEPEAVTGEPPIPMPGVASGRVGMCTSIPPTLGGRSGPAIPCQKALATVVSRSRPAPQRPPGGDPGSSVSGATVPLGRLFAPCATTAPSPPLDVGFQPPDLADDSASRRLHDLGHIVIQPGHDLDRLRLTPRIREFLGQIHQQTAHGGRVACPRRWRILGGGFLGRWRILCGRFADRWRFRFRRRLGLSRRGLCQPRLHLEGILRVELPGGEVGDGGVDLADTPEQVRVRDAGVRFERPHHEPHDGVTVAGWRGHGGRRRVRLRLPCGLSRRRDPPGRRQPILGVKLL